LDVDVDADVDGVWWWEGDGIDILEERLTIGR